MAHPHGLRLNKFSRIHGPMPFSDSCWGKLSKHIPSDQLTSEADMRLRESIMECCSWLTTKRIYWQESEKSAKAVQKKSRTELAQYERVIKTLRRTLPQTATLPQATTAWKNIKGFHDDRLGKIDIRLFDNLEILVKDYGVELILEDLQGRFERLQKLERLTIENPWDEFVRKVSGCFNREGINTTATGRTSKNDITTLLWFQYFMIDLDIFVLGKNGYFQKFIKPGDKEKMPSSASDAYLRSKEEVQAEEEIRSKIIKNKENALAATIPKAKRKKN